MAENRLSMKPETTRDFFKKVSSVMVAAKRLIRTIKNEKIVGKTKVDDGASWSRPAGNP